MSPSSRVALAAVAVLLLAVAPASASHAPQHRRPNLVVTSVDLTVTGQAIRGTVTVRNVGRALAPRSVTSIGGQLLATPALRVGRRATLPVATTIPANETRLLICADVRHRVRESREGDNCHAYVVPATTWTTPPAPTPANPGVHASTGPVAD